MGWLVCFSCACVFYYVVVLVWGLVVVVAVVLFFHARNKIIKRPQ